MRPPPRKSSKAENLYESSRRSWAPLGPPGPRNPERRRPREFKGRQTQRNSTALESVVFCYRRSFSFSVPFSLPLLPIEKQAFLILSVAFATSVPDFLPVPNFTLRSIFSTGGSLGRKRVENDYFLSHFRFFLAHFRPILLLFSGLFWPRGRVNPSSDFFRSFPGRGLPRGPKDWKNSRFRSGIETFKRPISDWNFQSRLKFSSEIENKAPLWGIIKVGIVIFKRDWNFQSRLKFSILDWNFQAYGLKITCDQSGLNFFNRRALWVFDPCT